MKIQIMTKIQIDCLLSDNCKYETNTNQDKDRNTNCDKDTNTKNAANIFVEGRGVVVS